MGRLLKGHLSTTHVDTYRAVPLPCCALTLRSRFQIGMVGARHGHSMVSVNKTWPHSVNEMVKTRSKPLEPQPGWGTLWYVCELASKRLYINLRF